MQPQSLEQNSLSAQPLEGLITELTPEWRRGDEKEFEIASETEGFTCN